MDIQSEMDKADSDIEELQNKINAIQELRSKQAQREQLIIELAKLEK